MNNGLGPQFMSSCMLNHLDLIIMPLNSKNKDSCTRKVQVLWPRPWRTSTQAFINLHCQSKSKPLGDSLSTLAGPNSGVYLHECLGGTVNHLSTQLETFHRAFVQSPFDLSSLCLCNLICSFWNIYSERGETSSTQGCLNNTILPTLYRWCWTVDVHVHLQIAISLHHLAWYNTPAAHCMFQQQVRHGIGPAFHVDIWQFSEKIWRKTMTCQTPWSCKMSQPKMQTQARHSSFGTVQMEKCLRQTCCWTSSYFRHKSTSKRTQCILKTYTRRPPGHRRNGGAGWRHLLPIKVSNSSSFLANQIPTHLMTYNI